MMDFKEETTYATHSDARNLIQYHQKSDALNIRKLHKSGFFHGNSSRNLNLSLTLPTAASNIFFKRTIRSLTKSKRALFIREINAGGWTSKFTPQDEARFCHLLRKTKKLRNFTLDKTWSEAVAPHFLRQLSKSFSKLYFFKDIKLNLFGSTNIKTEDCEKMGISLSRSLRLEKMDIQLVGCNGIGIKGVHYMFYRFSKLQHLQDLQVNLSNCYCLRNELGFLKFKDTIGRLPNLQSLNLTLSSNTLVNDECLTDIALGLAKLSTLKKLTISFGGCNMTNDGLLVIGKGITRLVNLEEIRLEFWGCLQIGDEGVGGLLKGFEGLKRLKKVDLNFANCSLITDVGVFAIRESLYKLEGLESLDIGLFGCSNVEKLAIETLWHKLGGLPKLRDGLNILS